VSFYGLWPFGGTLKFRLHGTTTFKHLPVLNLEPRHTRSEVLCNRMARTDAGLSAWAMLYYAITLNYTATSSSYMELGIIIQDERVCCWSGQSRSVYSPDTRRIMFVQSH